MDDEYMSLDEFRRTLMDMGPAKRAISEIRSLMATGGGWAPEPEEDPPEDLADADDPTKLRRMADWFDSRESDPEADTEVQDDLRRMARRFEEFVAPTAQLEEALQVLYRELLDHPLAPGPVADDSEITVSDALEVLGAWLSER